MIKTFFPVHQIAAIIFRINFLDKIDRIYRIIFGILLILLILSQTFSGFTMETTNASGLRNLFAAALTCSSVTDSNFASSVSP